MCDQRTEMLGGDCGPDGEEPALPSPTGGLGDEGRVSSGQQNGHAQSESLRREERRASDEEAGREDEELNVGSYELSRPGCVSASTESSENTDGSRGQVHREVMVTVAEMKKRIPSDKSSRSKASTVEALHYALRCVKQVQANSDYYRLLTQNCHDERRDATVCTLEELESVTCEHTLKNTAPSILCCKRTFLESAKFVELLFHQDVDVFYSHTAQPHLPPWSNSHTLGGLFDCAQVKSFFCRIRGGKDREGEMCYKPFRITPFLLTLQGTGRRGEDEEPCCLALAECILSGYEEPRIPMDKRIFTTTHSPGCVLLEVEERAVPLLGYLPQDLIGKSLLSFIHPDDRLLMLSVHRKVFKCAGQNSIEHSPVRLRCHNGDHITLETSWSSFINPWSRKVAFIIGRHKVRTIPLNKDVFAAPTKENVTGANEEIKDLQAKIYKLFLQPIHNNGSSGYGSLGSNGSHEHYISVASSSDGNLWEDSHREPQICANVDRVKSLDQRANLVSKHTTILGKTATARLPRAVLNPRILDHEDGSKQTHVASYQQINCVDNIIRYLDSYTGPALKRKSHSHSLASSSSSSSTSEDDMPAAATDPAHGSLDETKPLKDTPMGNEPADAALPSVRRDLNPNTEDQMFVDLTKEVLSAHTEKEEQEYVDVFRHRVLRSPYNSFLQLNNSSVAHSHHSGENPRPVSAGRLKRCRRGKPRHKCPKPQGSTDSYTSPAGPPRLVPDTYRPSSESSEPQMATPYSQTSPLNASFFPMMANQPGLEQLPRLQQLCGATPVVLQCPDRPQVSYSFNIMQSTQSQQGMQTFQIEPFHNLHPIVPTQGINPYMTPVMTVILPGNPTCTPGNQSIYSQGSPSMLPQAPITMAGFAPSSVPFSEPQFQAQPGLITQACTGPLLCSPSSVGEEEEAPEPQALFSSSRSSSPLQLNLLQEELPKLREGPRSTGDNLELHSIQSENPSESGDHDAQCTSQKLLDMLLQEDARSRTGSNASGSGQSGGSLGSGSGSKGTSHTGDSSKYFASNDSSDASCEARKSQEARTQHRHVLHTRDSLWEIIQNTPERVMMTYQIHTRDQNEVLAEDREKLRVLQPLQPWFSQEQREELAEVHPWIKQHTVPKETQGCGSCNSGSSVVYSPHPTALYNLSPREIPQQDYVGPVVDT